jgi:hypothetical protein
MGADSWVSRIEFQEMVIHVVAMNVVQVAIV